MKFTKSRGFIAPKPFNVRLEVRDGCHQWTMGLDDRVLAREAKKMRADGMSLRAVATELGTSKDKIDRVLKKHAA